MDEQPTQQENPQPIPSYIVIRFAGFGSALMEINFMNVTAGQMFAAAESIKLKGEQQFYLEEQNRMQREAERNIARPAQQILKPK